MKNKCDKVKGGEQNRKMKGESGRLKVRKDVRGRK